MSASGPSGPLVSKLTFSKNSFSQNSLVPDQGHVLLVLIWVQTVCNGFQQMKKSLLSRRELIPLIMTHNTGQPPYLKVQGNEENTYRNKIVIQSST